IAIVPFLDAADAAGNDAAAQPRKCTSRCENLPRGSAFRRRNTALVVPGHENSGSPPTACYFWGVTAAGVRSNISHTTLLLRFYPTPGDLRSDRIRDGQEPGRAGPQRRRPRPRKLPDAAAAPRPVARVLSAAGTLASLVTGAMRLTGGPAIERSTGEPGPAVAACGVTAALRIRMRTSAACAAVCTVTTAPSAPLRAVRPDRCT